jgi:hypothetical protein
MKQLLRLVIIAGIFLTSTIIIHTIRAPQATPAQRFRVACIPAEHAKHADRHLSPYAQLAHTTEDPETKKSWRCYFRFPARDVVCIPKIVATQQHIDSCPQFPAIDSTSNKICYILNKKQISIIELLQQKPPISPNTYTTSKNNFVKSWQEVRDILLGR